MQFSESEKRNSHRAKRFIFYYPYCETVLDSRTLSADLNIICDKLPIKRPVVYSRGANAQKGFEKKETDNLAHAQLAADNCCMYFLYGVVSVTGHRCIVATSGPDKVYEVDDWIPANDRAREVAAEIEVEESEHYYCPHCKKDFIILMHPDTLDYDYGNVIVQTVTKPVVFEGDVLMPIFIPHNWKRIELKRSVIAFSPEAWKAMSWHWEMEVAVGQLVAPHRRLGYDLPNMGPNEKDTDRLIRIAGCCGQRIETVDNTGGMIMAYFEKLMGHKGALLTARLQLLGFPFVDGMCLERWTWLNSYKDRAEVWTAKHFPTHEPLIVAFTTRKGLQFANFGAPIEDQHVVRGLLCGTDNTHHAVLFGIVGKYTPQDYDIYHYKAVQLIAKYKGRQVMTDQDMILANGTLPVAIDPETDTYFLIQPASATTFIPSNLYYAWATTTTDAWGSVMNTATTMQETSRAKMAEYCIIINALASEGELLRLSENDSASGSIGLSHKKCTPRQCCAGACAERKKGKLTRSSKLNVSTAVLQTKIGGGKPIENSTSGDHPAPSPTPVNANTANTNPSAPEQDDDAKPKETMPKPQTQRGQSLPDKDGFVVVQPKKKSPKEGSNTPSEQSSESCSSGLSLAFKELSAAISQWQKDKKDVETGVNILNAFVDKYKIDMTRQTSATRKLRNYYGIVRHTSKKETKPQKKGGSKTSPPRNSPKQGTEDSSNRNNYQSHALATLSRQLNNLERSIQLTEEKMDTLTKAFKSSNRDSSPTSTPQKAKISTSSPSQSTPCQDSNSVQQTFQHLIDQSVNLSVDKLSILCATLPTLTTGHLASDESICRSSHSLIKEVCTRANEEQASSPSLSSQDSPQSPTSSGNISPKEAEPHVVTSPEKDTTDSKSLRFSQYFESESDSDEEYESTPEPLDVDEEPIAPPTGTPSIPAPLKSEGSWSQPGSYLETIKSLESDKPVDSTKQEWIEHALVRLEAMRCAKARYCGWKDNHDGTLTMYFRVGEDGTSPSITQETITCFEHVIPTLQTSLDKSSVVLDSEHELKEEPLLPKKSSSSQGTGLSPEEKDIPLEIQDTSSTSSGASWNPKYGGRPISENDLPDILRNMPVVLQSAPASINGRCASALPLQTLEPTTLSITGSSSTNSVLRRSILTTGNGSQTNSEFPSRSNENLRKLYSNALASLRDVILTRAILIHRKYSICRKLSIVLMSQNQPTKKSRQQRRRQTRKQAKYMRHLANWRNKVDAVKSVSGAMVNIPLTSSTAYLKTVLDPVHMADYQCIGIPDGTTTYTRMYNQISTYSIPEVPADIMANTGAGGAWAKQTLSNFDSLTITTYYIVQTEFAAPLFVFYIGTGTLPGVTGTKDVIGCTQVGDTQISTLAAKSSYRLVAKSMTIDNIGQKMYRGGYFTCMTPPAAFGYTSSSNADNWILDLDIASTSQVAAYNGDSGVYAVLRPYSPTAMKLWKKFDASEVLKVTWKGATFDWTVTMAQANPQNIGWAQSVVAFTPPSPWSISASAKDTPNWMLRVTVAQQFEYQVPSAESMTHAMKDDGVINAVQALMQYHIPYYPASYNDWRKVLGKIRNTYKTYKPLIDVAAGYIPYGNAVVSGVDALLDRFDKAKQAGAYAPA